MEHAILGAGAIGGLMATALGSIGERVALIVRREKLASYPASLSLEQPVGTVTAAAHPTAGLAAPVDVLWIATKTYHLEDALKAVVAMPRLVVPLLNGVDHVPVLRSRFGHDRVAPATIAVEADRLAEGRFAQRSPAGLRVSALAAPLLSDVLAKLQKQLGFSCAFISNEQTLLWRKLCFLAPFALVTAASGKNKGEVFADLEWKRRLYACIAEATAVATASGADIDPARTQAIFDSSPGSMRSSMAKDLIAGRKLELDAIAGPIVRGGKRHGIDVPVTRELITAIEAKARY